MTKKYEKFEDWMVGKTVLWSGYEGVVTREYKGEGNCVWVKWESPGLGEAWIEIDSLEFLNVSSQQGVVDQPVPSEHTTIPWEVGQVVWDVVYGKGVVVDILEDVSYPVVAEFADEAMSYTKDGKTYETHGRTLFFSEPTIIADTMPPKKPFVPTLKEGEKILLKVPYLEEEKVAFVRREEENILYYMFEDGTKDYSGKSQITVTRIGEEIKWEN